MSENQEKVEVELKTQDRELLKSVIEAMKKPEPPIDKPKPAETHTHFKEGEDICPDCYPAVSKMVIQKELKGADHECEECGLPVRGEESGKPEWECKNCGHKYARNKD